MSCRDWRLSTGVFDSILEAGCMVGGDDSSGFRGSREMRNGAFELAGGRKLMIFFLQLLYACIYQFESLQALVLQNNSMSRIQFLQLSSVSKPI